MQEHNLSEKIRNSYLITYKGTIQQFNKDYFQVLEENEFELEKKIELGEKTIIFVKYKGDDDSLEQRLNILFDTGLCIEADGKYSIMD